MLRLKIVRYFLNAQQKIMCLLTMAIYNLIEYSDNYLDMPGSLWQSKRDEVPTNNADLTIDNSQSFQYKAALVGKTANYVNPNSFVKDTKIVLPLKYLSISWRSLEIPLINCKVHLELNWIEDCILSIAGDSAKFEITDVKLHIRIVTLSSKDNVNLTKQLSEEFKRSVHWKSYQTKPVKVVQKGKNMCELLNASFQGVTRLFVLAYFVAAGVTNDESGIKDIRKYFLPRGKIKNYNVLNDGRNLHDQPINDLIKQYDEVRKVPTGQGYDYTTGSLLGVARGNDDTKIRLYTILEQSKETMLEFS